MLRVSARRLLTGLSRRPVGLVRLFGSSSDYPDHLVVEMPALSPSMERGNIASWLKKEGDFVNVGDVLADVETDKATMGFEVQDEGYLAKILVPDGAQDLPIGQPVAVMVENEEDIPAFKDFSPDGAAAPKEEEEPQEQEQEAAKDTKEDEPQQQQQRGGGGGGERVFATPLARSIAAEKGVDLEAVSGSGPRNRVVSADVKAATPGQQKQKQQQQHQQKQQQQQQSKAPAPSAGGEYEDVPHSRMRRVIAERLTQSKQTIPHYYVTVDVEMDKLLFVRSELNQALEGSGSKVSVNDFIIKASALALRKVPQVNASWMDDAVRMYNYVDVSVAVSTDTGLITPVVRDADLKGLETISGEVRDLAERARSNKLAPEDYQGGTFTISNLGMFGVSQFAAIINPPQACILALGAAQDRVVPNRGDDKDETPFKTAKFMSATVSCDHRVVDGAVGAQFLQAFRSYVEDPMKMLL